MKRRSLGLRRFDSFAVKLRRRRLIKLRANAGFANGFEETHGAEARYFARVLGNIETDAHVRLRAEVINLVRLHLTQDGVERTRVIQVAVNQTQSRAFLVWILIEMIDAICVEGRRAANDAVNFVALFQQQFGQKRTILPGDA